jgi:hypothetical protein
MTRPISTYRPVSLQCLGSYLSQDRRLRISIVIPAQMCQSNNLMIALTRTYPFILSCFTHAFGGTGCPSLPPSAIASGFKNVGCRSLQIPRAIFAYLKTCLSDRDHGSRRTGSFEKLVRRSPNYRLLTRDSAATVPINGQTSMDKIRIIACTQGLEMSIQSATRLLRLVQ